jgi:hypothetical protein
MPLPDITRLVPATARRALTQRATILNRAQVTGTRVRPTRRGVVIAGVTGAAVAAAVLAAAPAAAGGPAPAVLRYHTFNVPGSIDTEAISINDRGVSTGDYVAKDKPKQLQGYIDAHGHITSFTYPTPAYYTHAVGINTVGTVVGFSQHGHTPYQGWLRSPSGHFTLINDPLAGTGKLQGTEAESVNDHGVVAGVYITSGNVFHGFVYQSGHFATVDVPHGFYGKPRWGSGIFGINNAGVMVGPYTPSAKNVTLGYAQPPRFPFSSITGPGAGTSPGDVTVANAISSTGVIVGTSNGPSGVSRGWLLSGSHFTILADPRGTGAFGTAPEGINGHGVVVGDYLDAQGIVHGFLVATGITGPASLPPSPPPAVGPAPARAAASTAPGFHIALPGRQGPQAGHVGTAS